MFVNLFLLILPLLSSSANNRLVIVTSGVMNLPAVPKSIRGLIDQSNSQFALLKGLVTPSCSYIIISGNTRVPDQTILSCLRFFPGQKLTLEDWTSSQVALISLYARPGKSVKNTKVLLLPRSIHWFNGNLYVDVWIYVPY
jgi:hypothetical protein